MGARIASGMKKKKKGSLRVQGESQETIRTPRTRKVGVLYPLISIIQRVPILQNPVGEEEEKNRK